MSVKSATDTFGRGLPLFALGAAQNVSFNAAGGSSTQSTTLSSSAGGVIISVPNNSSDVRVAMGKNPTASSTSLLIPAPAMVAFQAGPGDIVAVLSNDTGTGSIGVAELQGTPLP